MSIYPQVAIAADSADLQCEVIETNHLNQPTQESLDDGRFFEIGDVVDVMPRLWSGINKPGGAARIKEVTYDEEEEEYTYTVKYILGGIEKEVSGIYITSADLEGKKQRGTIGRCRWCKSFIRDCEHDQNNDPFFQPVPAPRFFNHQQAGPVSTNNDTNSNLSTTHQRQRKRKRSGETTEQRQERKQLQEQNLLQMQQARREALQVREEEQEQQQLLSSRPPKTFLPDDESTLDGTHPDMYDSMDLVDDEEWVPSDSELATALPGRVGRVVQDSSDDEEAPRSIAVISDNKSLVKDTRTIFVDVVTAPHSVQHAQSAATLPMQLSVAPLTTMTSSVTVQPGATTKVALQPQLPVSSGSVSAPVTTVVSATAATTNPAAAAITTSVHASHTTTNDAAHRAPAPSAQTLSLPSTSRSYAHMSAVDIAQDLHQRILESCVGSAAFGFINNSRSALNDRTAAAVNDTFNQLISSIRTLSEEAKIALYHVSFDWFESLYRENMFDASLEAIETSHKALRNGQKAELSQLQKELDELDDNMEVTLQQLARAGFDVFEKLGKIKDKEVRRMRRALDAYNSQVSGTRVSARKRLERLRLRLQETSELWGCVDSESNDSGSESDGNASASHGHYSTHVPSFPAAKMARATSSTSFSRSHSNNSHNLSRSSTHWSGRRGNQTVMRARSGEGAVNEHNYDNNDFSIDYDMHEEDASTADAQRQRGGKGSSAPRTASSSTALSRSASNNHHSNAATTTRPSQRQPYSKRVSKEMEFIFGNAKTHRNTSGAVKTGSGGGGGGFSGSSSNRDRHNVSGGIDGGASGSVVDKFVPLYRRTPAPSVLDLPRHIRYHGRVTVLEGPLMGTVVVVVPVTIERSTSGSLGAASVNSWSGNSALTPMESGAHGDESTYASYDNRFDSTPGVSAASNGHSRVIDKSYTATESTSLLGQFTEPTQAYSVLSLDTLDESLVDVVLSSMVNPFVVEPPLHLRRQFYQLPSPQELSGSDNQAVYEVWAEMFVNHLVAEGTAEGIVRGLALAATSAVQVVLQRLALYEEASARSSQLHPNHTPRILKSGFNEKTVFAELVSLALEKVSRLNALFACVTSRQFLSPAAGSADLMERVSNVKLLTQSFDTMVKVTCSRVAKERDGFAEDTEDTADKPLNRRNVAQNLCTFLRVSTVEDSKSDELAVFVALSLLRVKVITLKNCALLTLETAKTRPLIDTNDQMSVFDRIEEEVADWDVMNDCFSALLMQQQEVLSALLVNQRLTLAVLHYLSEVPPNGQEVPNLASSHTNGERFERGIGGVAKQFTALLFEILASLRALHGSINAARTSSSASAHGTRVWAAYNASREQANGVIATYPKYVWRDVVLAIYAHIVRSPQSQSDIKMVHEMTAWFDEKQLMRAMVNPTVHHQRHNTASESGSGSLAYLSEKESIWAVMTTITHLLRTVKMTELAGAAIPPTVATNNRVSSRVDGAWSLLKGLAHASLESVLLSAESNLASDLTLSATEVEIDTDTKDNSNAGGAGIISSLLRRVGHFAALWTDSPTEATALTLSLLHKASSRFGSLFPLYCTVSTALESRGASKSALASGPPPLDQKSVLFLCFYSFFDHRHAAAQNHHVDDREVRNAFTKHLAFLVSMLFETFKLPSNVGVSTQHRSINAALDSGNRQRELTQSSLQALDAVRDAFKALLYNAYSEACAPHDGTAIAGNLTAIRTAANKLPRSHQKLRILALLESIDGVENGNLQAGNLLLSLIAEMSAFFGPETVRQKLKLYPAPGAVAMPLQQQVMELLSHKLVLATQGAFSVSATSSVSVPNLASALVSGTGAGDSLLSEVDRLLQRVPIHQQQQQSKPSGEANTNATTVVNPTPAAVAPQLDASAVHLCLLWQAGLITFPPFPIDAASLTVHEETRRQNVLQEADVKRIVESQRAQFFSFEPLLHLLRQSLQLQQNRSQLVNVFGAKAFVDTSLCASLSVCAAVLGNMDALLGARGAIAVDALAGSSGDVVTTQFQMVLLVTPFFTELLNVVHVCLSSTESSAAKDGLPYSAAYVLSQFVLHLHNWHRASRQLLSATQSALNIDSAAKAFLSSVLKEEEDQLCQLLSGALRLRPAPAVSSYKSNHTAGKAPPSVLVAGLLTLLTGLSHSISKTDISVLDPSVLFRTSSGDTCTTEMARKIRMHKGNTSPGCCLAICQALGTLVSLITDITRPAPSTITTAASSASSELHRSGLATALLSEVTECLEKIDQSATATGANALFGDWLKVVFWLPILQAASLETEVEVAGRIENASCLSLVSAHFPALVCVWVGCAALGESTITSHRILQQIDFAAFHRLLVHLAAVCVRDLRAKCSSVGVAKLSSAEMQCLRLAEALTQVNSLVVGSHSINASVFVVRFLRLLSAGSASSVLASLLLCAPVIGVSDSGSSGGHSYSFPATHRVSFEATNVQISRELLKCLQVLKLESFRCGETPKFDSAEAKQKHALEASAAKLKGLFGDIAYLYRVLIVSEVPPAEFHPVGAVNGDSHCSTACKTGVVQLTARLLRNLQPFPRMVTLDLAFSFLGDIVEQDAMTTIGLMFKHAARGDSASPEQHSVLKNDLHRNFLCNVPKYLLLASDTPYSTRQTAWRTVLAPMLLTPAHTATGLCLAKQLASSKPAVGGTVNASAPMPMLTEHTMGEEAYLTLLVCALTLALPVPEQLALLGPAASRAGDQSLRTKFVELLSARLKLPVKQATLWALYAQLMEIVKNTSLTSFPAPSLHDGDTTAGEDPLRQDSQLTRFKQYLLFGGGASGHVNTTASGTGASANKLGLNLTGQKNSLWEQISSKATEVLRLKIAEDQQRLSLQKNASFQPASAAMFVLPWAAVRACLHLHTSALEDVLASLIAPQRIIPPSSLVPVSSFSRSVLNVVSEREDLMSLLVASAVYAVRGATLLCDMQHQARASYPLITETSKQLLQSLLQYCTLAAESVSSSWSHLQAMVNDSGNSVGDVGQAVVDLSTDAEMIQLWFACVRQMRQVFKLDALIQSDICSFVVCGWQLMRGFYQLANCNNMLIVESFLTSAAPLQGIVHSLPPAPQVIFAATQCACQLCSHTASLSVAWDGTENVSCVQTLQLAVVQLHRDLQLTFRPNSPALTAQQSTYLQELLGARLNGVCEALERMSLI